MIDFTLHSYSDFLHCLKDAGYIFQPFRDFIQNPAKRVIILRHDVDKLPDNSLKTAEMEGTLGIRGSYYFRAIPESYDEEIIKKIAGLGHEIGYHYEDLALCNGNYELARISFEKNLNRICSVADVQTICMHGSPTSKWDNRDLWNKYNYRNYGIIGEPNFDVDFTDICYLTDTGRRWNGGKFSVRDKVNSKYNFNFNSTFDIINNISLLPDQIMITIHPQRWTDNIFLWTKELIFQNIKNSIKYFIPKKYFSLNRNEL